MESRLDRVIIVFLLFHRDKMHITKRLVPQVNFRQGEISLYQVHLKKHRVSQRSLLRYIAF